MSRKKEIRQTRIYSLSLKKTVVKQVERGELTVLQACRTYDIKAKQTVYNWIYKFSRTLEKPIRVVVEKDSVDKRLQDSEKRIKELEASVGRKQIEIDLYKHMVDLAKEEYGIDLKKNFGGRASSGKERSH
jgi:transposase-like protein